MVRKKTYLKLKCRDVISGLPLPPALLREPWRSCPGPLLLTQKVRPLDYVLVALSPSPSPPSPFLVVPPGGAPLGSSLPPLPTAKSLCSLRKLNDTPCRSPTRSPSLPPTPAMGKWRDNSNQLRFNKTHFPSSMLALRPLGRDHHGSCPSAAPQERQEGTRISHFLSFGPFLTVKNHNFSPAGRLGTRPRWGPCSKSPSRLVTICLLPPGLILQVRGASLLWFYCQEQEAGPGHGRAGPQEQLWGTEQPRQRKP